MHDNILIYILTNYLSDKAAFHLDCLPKITWSLIGDILSLGYDRCENVNAVKASGNEHTLYSKFPSISTRELVLVC